MMKRLIGTCSIIFLASCGFLEKTYVSVSTPVQIDLSALKAVAQGVDDVRAVQLTVSGDDMETVTSTLTGPFTSTTAVQFNVSVPIGLNRLFTVEAAIQNETHFGYFGATVQDVPEGGASVPVSLAYVNFATDDSGDAQPSTAPDITQAAFSVNTENTADVSDDILNLEVDFAQPVQNLTNPLVLFFEFDIDSNPLTGRSETVLHSLLTNQTSDALIPSFSAGSEYYLVVEATNDAAEPLSATLYDQNDQEVMPPEGTSAIFTASFTASNKVVAQITRSLYTSAVDPDGVLLVNVLAGTKNTLNTMTDAPTFSAFTPSDLLIGNEPIGTFLFQLSFDTSTL